MTTPPKDDRTAPATARAGSTLPWPTKHASVILLLFSVTWAMLTAYGITMLVRKGWSTSFAPPGSSTDSAQTHEVAAPPALASMEARVRSEHDLVQRGQTGIPATFALLKGGGGERLILPPNSAGIENVIVELDPSGKTVWLAYGGEVTGKGTRDLPRGAVEQLVRERPTVLVFTFSAPAVSPAQPDEWVVGLVEMRDSHESAAELFTTPWPEGWATRFRDEWTSRSSFGSGAVPADAGGDTQ